jgi:hypothetical protein
MFYRIPEDFFSSVVMVDKLISFVNEDKVNDSEGTTGKKTILEEADEEYLESQIGGKSCY